MWSPTGLIPCFSKTEGKYLRYCAASPFPLRGNTTQAREVARRISGAVAREAYAKVIYQQTLILHITFFASRFPLPHFTLAILFALLPPCVYRLFACVLFACLIALMSEMGDDPIEKGSNVEGNVYVDPPDEATTLHIKKFRVGSGNTIGK